MKKSVLVLFAVLLFAACQPKSDVISVSDFDQKASELVDQVINIEGVAVHVCQESHMKLFLSETQEIKNTVLVMNNPDNEPFGNELIGKTVTVTGKVVAYVQEPECTNEECDKAEECEECEEEKSEEEHCATEGTANTVYYIECQSVKAE